MDYVRRAKVRVMYQQMAALLDKMGNTVLELMAHPDATANQIMATHESYVKTHAMLCEVRQGMQKKGIDPWTTDRSTSPRRRSTP